MREIKFRGFNPFEEKWYFGSFVKTGTGAGYIIPQNLIAENIPQFRVDVNSVGQFTGLKDKNGTEIYEGDIVHSRTITNGFQCTGIVDFEDGQYIFRVNNAQFGRADWSQTLAHKLMEYTVIGNKFEHPELLNN